MASPLAKFPALCCFRGDAPGRLVTRPTEMLTPQWGQKLSKRLKWSKIETLAEVGEE